MNKKAMNVIISPKYLYHMEYKCSIQYTVLVCSYLTVIPRLSWPA